MQPNRNVLAIGVSREEFERLVPFLARQPFELDRFPSARGALELVDRVPFELLLVRFPLPDMELEPFLEAVRRDGGPCQNASLLLLSPVDRRTEAESYLGRGANRAVSLEASEDEVQESVSALVNVAPRKSARFLANLEISLGDTSDRLLCQTENFSSSGMLVRTNRRYDLGTEIEFDFLVGSDPRPIRGVAEVVRHTAIGRDEVAGIGLRFLSFAGDSHRRFRSFVDTL